MNECHSVGACLVISVDILTLILIIDPIISDNHGHVPLSVTDGENKNDMILLFSSDERFVK